MRPALMVDIEALGKEPGGERCLILSIAAVPFDPYERHPLNGAAWKLSPVGQETRTIDDATLRWWLAQSTAAVAASFGSGERPVNVLLDLAAYAKANCTPDFRMWANGPTYDLAALSTLYDDHGIPRPWGYNKARDLRTLWDLAPLLRARKATHDPVDDCHRQIDVVWRIHEQLGLLRTA